MTIVLVVLVAVAALSTALWVAVGRRRVRAREEQQAQALVRLSERFDTALAPLRRPPIALPDTPPPAPELTAPLVAERLPGRAAFVDAVTTAVADARAGGRRLSAALVAVSGDTAPAALADNVRDLAGGPVYAVGPSSVAMTLPGLGRADALGVLARLEAAVASSGRAVELEPGEDAVELVARLLAGEEEGRG